ncbi:hypothetical protein F4824DRAFT_463697 [Ustulina deusta]|nr:hypothetical protein F4824DRAFT_463697 [Ustulina deusta]
MSVQPTKPIWLSYALISLAALAIRTHRQLPCQNTPTNNPPYNFIYELVRSCTTYREPSVRQSRWPLQSARLAIRIDRSVYIHNMR